MKAVICGAGIAGLALAQRLGGAGWEVVVLEKAPAPRPEGYMIDFFGPGYEAALAMGLGPRLRELGYRVQEVAYIDASGRVRGSLSYGRFAIAVGGRLVSIMRPDLERALLESLPASVELRYGTSLTHIDNAADGVRMVLTSGEVLGADLLVGADGMHSTVRALEFGDERKYVHYLGFHTAAFAFDDATLHAEVRGRFCLTDTARRQMGFYALRDGRVAVFAVHQARSAAMPSDPRAALRQEYAGCGWMTEQALAQCPPSTDVYYDQVAQIVMPHWSRGRVTLVGDACGAVSLLAGQGASLGIAGACVLADQLATGEAVPTALARYERTWRPVVASTQQFARKSARWFLPESGSQILARRLVLKLARLPRLDRFFTTAFVGKTPSLSRHSATPAFPQAHLQWRRTTR